MQALSVISGPPTRWTASAPQYSTDADREGKLERSGQRGAMKSDWLP